VNSGSLERTTLKPRSKIRFSGTNPTKAEGELRFSGTNPTKTEGELRFSGTNPTKSEDELRFSGTNPTKTEGELRFSGRISSACYNCGTRCVTAKKHEHHPAWICFVSFLQVSISIFVK
jgi:hypothetical protein